MKQLENRIHFQPGTIVSYHETDYIIKETLDFISVLANKKKSNKTEILYIKDIKPSGELNNSELTPKKNIHLVNESEFKKAYYRYDIIKPLLNSKRTEKLVIARSLECKVGQASIYRWIKEYEKTGSLSSLLPLKTGGKDKSRLPQELEDIVISTIGIFYLNKQKHSIQDTIQEILFQLNTLNIPAPHPNTIRNRIRQLSNETIIKKREGSRKASELYDPKVSQYDTPNVPLSVVQIDHTKLDIILVDQKNRKPVGRPWITLAIDKFSRMITGFYISFDPPGAMGTGLCIAHTILPKEKWLNKMECTADWPVWGVMKAIHLDNAGEFRGKMLERACPEYNIEIIFRKIGEPRYGAHIERLIGNFSKKIHSLSGTTFSNPKERGEYNSEKKAVLTLYEFEQWFTTLVTKMYHQQYHEGILCSPISLYKKGVFGSKNIKGIGLPSKVHNERKLILDFMPYVERVIRFTGVHIDHIRYYADVLRKYINSTEKNSNKKRKFIFKRDPRDISVVHFLDPDTGEHYPIRYRNISNDPISIWEYRKALKHLVEQGRKNIDESMIFEAYKTMKDIEQEAIRKTKKYSRDSLRSQERKKNNLEIINNSKYENKIFENNNGIDSITPFDEMEEINHDDE